MQFGINPETFAEIIKLISNFNNVTSITVFGSRAKGNYKQGSDLDIALHGDLDLKTVTQISLSLDELYLPFKVDLVQITKTTSPDLVEHIQRAGQVVYKRERK